MNADPQHTGPLGHGTNEDYYSNGPVEPAAHEAADTYSAQSYPRPAAVDAGVPPPPVGPPPATGNYGQQGYYAPPSPGSPPGYPAEIGEGAGAGVGDVKPHYDPNVSGPNVYGQPGQPQRPVSPGMQFAPPPTSSAHHGGHGSKLGEKFYHWSVKAGVPVNRIAHRLGAEAFWPMTLDLECEKAARILRGFCRQFPLFF